MKWYVRDLLKINSVMQGEVTQHKDEQGEKDGKEISGDGGAAGDSACPGWGQ